MSHIALDTCAIINLHNGEVLAKVLTLTLHRFAVGPAVLDECGAGCPPLQNAIANGTVVQLDDSDIPAIRYLELLQQEGLGEGETECLVYGEIDPTFVICTDDRRARSAATRLFGANRVMGSIRLLRHCISQGILTDDEAFAAYKMMLRKGGFLPVLTKEEFLDDDAARP